MARKTHYEDCDILVVGGGMAGTGAAFEARYWGKDMKIIVAEKAPANSTICVILPDTGERYLSTPLFEGISEESDEEWLSQQKK